MIQCYDKLMLKQKNALAGQKPTLLLHVCCAGCASYCLTQLVDTFDVTLYYSNDNITDQQEWQKRLDEINRLVDIVNNGQFVVQPVVPVKVVAKPHAPQDFLQAAKGYEKEKEGGKRCTICFEYRIGSSVQYAQQNNFQFVTTTLTVSPYKNSKTLNEIGKRLTTGTTKWLPNNFKKRNGYDISIELCDKYNIYRQHYCGCCFSFAQMQQSCETNE